MPDETINVVIMLMLFFGFMSVMRGRSWRRRHRDLQRTVDHLQSLPLAPAPAPVISGASAEQVARLEDRVRVLERIVTDRGSSLAAEIEALRDARPASAQREMERNV